MTLPDGLGGADLILASLIVNTQSASLDKLVEAQLELSTSLAKQAGAIDALTSTIEAMLLQLTDATKGNKPK